MNANLYAASILEQEIGRLVKQYNMLVEKGDKETHDKEEWLPYLHIRQSYPDFGK